MLRTGNFIICKFILNAIDFLDYWTFPKLASWLLRRWKHLMLRILFAGNPFHIFLSHIGVLSLIGLLFSLTFKWGDFGAWWRKFQLSQTAGKRNLSKVRRRKSSVISDSDRKVGMIDPELRPDLQEWAGRKHQWWQTAVGPWPAVVPSPPRGPRNPGPMSLHPQTQESSPSHPRSGLLTPHSEFSFSDSPLLSFVKLVKVFSWKGKSRRLRSKGQRQNSC